MSESYLKKNIPLCSSSNVLVVEFLKSSPFDLDFESLYLDVEISSSDCALNPGSYSVLRELRRCLYTLSVFMYFTDLENR